jgi:hypothetical protein
MDMERGCAGGFGGSEKNACLLRGALSIETAINSSAGSSSGATRLLWIMY